MALDVSKPFDPFQAAREENRKTSQAAGKYRGAATSRRKLDTGKEKTKAPGKGKQKKTEAPTVSVQPSSNPTLSHNPTISMAPSSKPSASPSASPTKSPKPSASPSVSPSSVPSATPTKSPPGSGTGTGGSGSGTGGSGSGTGGSGSGTDGSGSGTGGENENNAPGTVTITNDNEGEALASCETTVIPSRLEQFEQLVQYEFKMCLDTTDSSYPGDMDSVEEFIKDSFISSFVDEFINCDYANGDWHVSGLLVRANPECSADADAGVADCFDCTHEYEADILVPTSTSRRLESVERRAALKETLTNPETEEFGGHLTLYLAQLASNVGFVSSTSFEGFSNVEGVQGDDDDDGSGTNALVSTNDSGNSDNGSVFLISGLVVGCAVAFLVVIFVAATRRRREDEKARSMQHVLMHEDDPYADDFEDGQYSAGAIMKDLDRDTASGDSDTLDDSLAVSYPQVYVMGEGESTLADNDDELRFTSGLYQEEEPGASVFDGQSPTFVTTDLKRAMRDLEPPRKSVNGPRGYIHDDTVDL